MLPYNYTLAFENNQKGIPLMQPLFFEEPTNLALQTVSESYLWGTNFLVKPITKAGVTDTEMYFPKSNNWFDFYSNEKHTAGTTATVKVVEDHIPTFVRGGSFIPMIKTIQNTSKYSLDNFDLHFYFDETVANSSGKTYNDDGSLTNAFEKGMYELLHFNSNNSNKTLTIKLTAEIGKNYQTSDKNVSLLVHNIKAKRVFVNGKEILYKTFNEPLIIPVSWEKGSVQEIKIQY
jgi:alpha-glucosidase (family GH31 glycosyl hydrolase)